MSHPPPLPEWPDYVKDMYAAGCKRIDELRAENLLPDGTVKVPFRCYGCDTIRVDVSLINGDGLPMCRECVPPELEMT